MPTDRTGPSSTTEESTTTPVDQTATDTGTTSDQTSTDTTTTPADTGAFNYDPLGIATEDMYSDEAKFDESIANVNDSYDKFGNVITSDTPTKEYTFGDKGVNVLGLPLYFNPLADPFNRVYEHTFESDLPLVFITPGKPKINKRVVSFNSGGGVISANDVLGSLIPADQLGIRNARNYNDTRYVRFERSYSEYYGYVQTMLTYLYTMLGFSGTFKFEDYFKENDKVEGIAFYADKSTTVSESSNNSYSAPSMASSVNNLAGQAREYRQYIGMQEGGVITNVIDGILKIFEGAISSIPVIGKVLGAFGSALSGDQLYYPDLWQDGKFSKNYNLSFKFFSPYGDPESIFRFVYVPFISLLALSLPLQDGIYAYKQPFLVRLSCPGYFELECGAITSIDFKRGGDDSLWTSGNMPNEIEVTMSVQDLYPTVLATNKIKNMKWNIGLASFLECMAGITFNELSVIQRMGKEIDMYRNEVASNVTLPGLRYKWGDFWSNVNNNVARS